MIRVPEREETEKEAENLFEEITEHFSNMGEETEKQFQQTQKVPNKVNPKMFMQRHIIMKKTKIKVKERILTAARKKQLFKQKVTQLTCQQKFCRTEECDMIFKVMKYKTNNHEYSANKVIIYSEVEINSFTDNKMLRVQH